MSNISLFKPKNGLHIIIGSHYFFQWAIKLFSMVLSTCIMVLFRYGCKGYSKMYLSGGFYRSREPAPFCVGGAGAETRYYPMYVLEWNFQLIVVLI